MGLGVNIASLANWSWQSGVLTGLLAATGAAVVYLRARWSKLAPFSRCIWLSIVAHLALAVSAMLVQSISLEPPPSLARGPVTLAWFPGDGGYSLTSVGGMGTDADSQQALASSPVPTLLTSPDDLAMREPDTALADSQSPSSTDAEQLSSSKPDELEQADDGSTAVSPNESEGDDSDSTSLPETSVENASSDTATSNLEKTHSAAEGETTPPLADEGNPTPTEVDVSAPDSSNSADDAAATESSVLSPTSGQAQSTLSQVETTSSTGPGVAHETNDPAWSPTTSSELNWQSPTGTSLADRSAIPSAARDKAIGNTSSDPLTIYANRGDSRRTAAARRFGGSERTEASVASALAWLASVQNRDGRWDASRFEAGHEIVLEGQNRRSAGRSADTGVTALALLAFLGAGQTHQSGAYQSTVERGIGFLRLSQAADGSFAGGANVYEAMYCHAMAVFAMAECYALTQDAGLRRSLEDGVRYSLDAQHPTSGGWRYQPWRTMPNDLGDMSLLGWHLMSLRAAERAGIDVPASVLKKMERFLDSVAAGKSGALAKYRPDRQTTPAMTAESLLCRTFLGQRLTDAFADEAASYLLAHKPGVGEANHYFWYYSTLALHQLQGESWETWNQALQQELLNSQQTRGALRGSWNPDALWGQYGGRVYSTSLCTMCLESYYRYAPVAEETAASQTSHRY